ncbi:hypothetical protein H4S08_001402 [Coemansia sp. RSA 1365]|nr:hypothetical protein H4S08_001402 [Coemansia sp. RSA 1365]
MPTLASPESRGARQIGKTRGTSDSHQQWPLLDSCLQAIVESGGMLPSFFQQPAAYALQQTLHRRFHRAAQTIVMPAPFTSDCTSTTLVQTGLRPPLQQAHMLGGHWCCPRPCSTTRKLHRAVLFRMLHVPKENASQPEAPLPKSLERHHATPTTYPSGEYEGLHWQDIMLMRRNSTRKGNQASVIASSEYIEANTDFIHCRGFAHRKGNDENCIDTVTAGASIEVQNTLERSLKSLSIYPQSETVTSDRRRLSSIHPDFKTDIKSKFISGK